MIVTIDPLSGLPEAHLKVSEVLRDHGAALSPAVFGVVGAYYPSSMDRSARTAEALYAEVMAAAPGAVRDDLAVACAQLSDFCTDNAIHPIGQTDRGLKISGACRRLLGLGAQAEADDPPVELEFTEN